MNALSGFDMGGSGSEGPWIGWSAKGSQDGTVPQQSFFLRDQNGRTPFNVIKTNGIVLDLDTIKTGWCYSSGVAGQAPIWNWNPSISQFIAKPADPAPGQSYKKGFSMRCAIGSGETATWEDSGAGAFAGLVAIVPALQQAPEGKLPLIKMIGSEQLSFGKGASTHQAILEVASWVDRPDCLKLGVAVGVAAGPVEAAAPARQTPPPPPPAPPAAAHPSEF